MTQKQIQEVCSSYKNKVVVARKEIRTTEDFDTPILKAGQVAKIILLDVSKIGIAKSNNKSTLSITIMVERFNSENATINLHDDFGSAIDLLYYFNSLFRKIK